MMGTGTRGFIDPPKNEVDELEVSDRVQLRCVPMNMAQENQPINRLGGFADSTFVLINGKYWDCNVNRRRIQGQVCLDEFTDILLQCILLRERPYTPMYNTTTLEEQGPLEVLKYAFQNDHLFDRAQDPLGFGFADYVNELRKLRNKLTHEIRSWTIDMFRNFLEAMHWASSYLVQPGQHDTNLDRRVNEFISKCGRELNQIRQFQDMY